MNTVDFELFLNAVHDLRITNAITIASLVVLVYDILLTLPEEIEYVWNAEWTYGKLLFFLNRYPVVAVSIVLIASQLDVATDLKMCEVSAHLDGWSMLAFILPVQLIFCLRTAELWNRDRKVILFLGLLMLGCDIVIGVFVWMVEQTGHFMLPQWPGLRDLMGCYSTISNQVSPKVIIPAVAALMTFDATILALTILRFVRIRREGEGQGSVMRILFRDGVVYYVVVLVSSIANLILYAVVPKQHVALIGALVPILRTTMSVCASRLVLNLRGVIESVRLKTWSDESASTLVRTRNAGSELSLNDEKGEGEDDAVEMRVRLGVGTCSEYAYRHPYEAVGETETPTPMSSPGSSQHILLRPRSTAVIEIVSGPPSPCPDTNPEAWKRAMISEGGAMFDIMYPSSRAEEEEDGEEPMTPIGVAV